MARITTQMLRARLTEQLTTSPPNLADTLTDHSSIDLLLIPGDEVFITEAFRRILGRKPDLDGMHHFLQVLKTHPRQMVVDAITSASENIEDSKQQVPPSDPGFVDLTNLEQVESVEELVRESYRRILAREGDRAGLEHYQDLLNCGASKAQVISMIASSAEARARNVRFLSHGNVLPVPGELSFRTRLLMLVRRLKAGPRLGDANERPEIIDLTNLEQIESEDELVRESYRRILGRDADRAGLRHYRDLLICSASKVQVISMIASSAEAKARNVCFLSHGNVLPPPGTLSITTRLQLFVWELAGRSRLEDAVADLKAQARIAHEQYDAMRQESQTLSDKLLRIETEQEAFTVTIQGTDVLWTAKAHELSDEMGRRVNQLKHEVLATLNRVQGELKRAEDLVGAGLEGVIQKLYAIAGDTQIREEAIQVEQNRARTEISQAISSFHGQLSSLARVMNLEFGGQDARLGGVFEKLDAIAGDMQIRDEAIQVEQNRARTEISQAIASFREQANLIARMIRPPIFAGEDVLVTEVDDFVLAIPREDWSMAAYYAFWGSVDRGLTQCFTALLRPGMLVADIGSNIGLHTLHAARAVGEKGKVYSFEPTPRTFGVLRKNVEVSGFESVELFPFAVLDRPGQVELQLHEGACGLNTVFGDGEIRNSVLVEATTLDEALSGREQVDVVKIDAEGAEPFIFRGMKRILAANPALIILLEFAPTHLQRAGVAAGEFLHDLRAAGFEIRRIDDLTGALSTPKDEQLLITNSSNLHLQRPGLRAE